MSARRKVSASAKDATATLVIKVNFGPEHAATFLRDLPAHPPFNDYDTALRDTEFFQRGAKMQVVSDAKDNMAGFVLANGSMSSNQSGEGDIRRALIEADLDCLALAA